MPARKSGQVSMDTLDPWAEPAPEITDDQMAGQLLHLVRKRFGMDLAWISRFDQGRQVVETVSGELKGQLVTPGFSPALAGPYRVRVVSGDLPAVIPDAKTNPITSALETTRRMGIGAHLAAPLRAGGHLYGTFVLLRDDHRLSTGVHGSGSRSYSRDSKVAGLAG
ncbi:GAF domain-containing protein [Nakamurella alba]|nr:GAF domain-containing protein [Nakamurella alba]